MAVSYASVKAEYARLWRTMTINPSRIGEFQATAKRLMKGMDRYKAVEKATGVPAALIAILHERESNANFDTYLGNGQPLSKKTTIVPVGRGPFRNFEEGAIDALNIDGLASIKSWPLEMIIFKAEGFNGFGYRNGPVTKGVKYPPMRSPYLWGGTNHQQRGKYTRDRYFDPSVMDQQLGAVGILFTLMNMDLSLYRKLESVSDPVAAPPAPVPPKPAASEPAKPVTPPVANPVAENTAKGVAASIIGAGMAFIAGVPWELIVGALVIGGGLAAVVYFAKRK